MLRSSGHSLARKWRTEVITSEHWTQDLNVAAQPGEAGGFRVLSDSGVPGYLKPTQTCDALHPRAANEKIVADVAWELDLPAAPVVLFRRDPCPPGHEVRTCVSLVIWPEIWEWGQLMQIQLSGPVAALVRSTLARSCGVIALDTLVGNTDRDNARNAIIGVDSSNPAAAGFMYIDHAYSLNHGGQWDTPEKLARVSVPPFPQMLRDAVDKAVLTSAIDRVEHMADSIVEEIVGRIPEDYMDAAHRAVVVTGLKERRPLVRAALAPTFGL